MKDATEPVEGDARAALAARAAHRLVEELHLALEAERARVAEIPLLEARIRDLERELEALRATKVFRYTSLLRRWYGSYRARPSRPS